MISRALLVSGFLLIADASQATCSISDFQIKSKRAEFVDRCKTRSCPHMKGVAVLYSECPQAMGVQVRITAFDKKGTPLATRELWPAGVRNIPPGEYPFSMDNWLDFSPEMSGYKVEVVDLRIW